MSEHASRGTLERAIEIAAATHAGQTDKGGAPYILPPPARDAARGARHPADCRRAA